MMDQVVRQALEKWPDVPACFGWLRLDARGQWRMRDERAQRLGLAGEPIHHPALLGFINRNYDHDEQGRWFFQNGPQRVYVDLELTPYIARTDPVDGLLLHTGQALGTAQQAWLTSSGQLLLRAADQLAAIDDRDGAAVLAGLRCAGMAASDEQICRWLDGERDLQLHWQHGQQALPVQRMDDQALGTVFGFIAEPRATPC